MINLKNKTYISPKKADADIHAGGNFFWKIYAYKITFDDSDRVELYKIFQSDNGIQSEKEELIFEGIYTSPKVGRYDIEIKLTNKDKTIQRSWCGKIVSDGALICHGFIKSTQNDYHNYETEIFEI